jgi:Winged helix-turn-helix DNA-binding
MLGTTGALGPPAGRMPRILQDMSATLGPVAATAFVAAAFIGTAATSRFGSVALVKASGMSSAFALALCGICTIVGVAAELLKLGLATRMCHLGRRCPPLVLVLWASCTGYAWLMPVLLLAQMPLWLAGGGMFAACAIGWAFVQLMSGLAAVNWSDSTRQARVDLPSASVDSRTLVTAPIPNASATSKRPARLDADTAFALLCDLVLQPNAALGTRIRVGKDNDISASQRDLARHLGLPRSTLRRRLLRLEGQGRLCLGYTDDGTTTHIKLHLTRA